MGDKSPEISVSPEKLESFLPLLGLELTEDGYIRDIETGDIKTTENGEKLTEDEIGFLGHDEEDDNIVLVENDFPSIVNHLSDRDERSEEDSLSEF